MSFRPEEITPSVLANLKYSMVTPDDVEDILARARAIYTEEEIQRYLDVDEGISAEEALRDFEEMVRQHQEKTQ